MATFSEVQHIQAYLRESARQQYLAVALPPFTLFLHPTNAFPSFNYAIPDSPVGGDLAAELARVRASFQEHQRTPRFEFYEAFAPALSSSLEAGGFREEHRQWSMVCTPKDLHPVPRVPGLEVAVLGPDSPEEDIRGFIQTQRQGFNPQDITIADEDEITEKRRDITAGGWQAFLARMEGEPASAAVLNNQIEGVCEVAGVATREPFRRRGIASYLVWQASRTAFESGAETAVLTAEDEHAGQIYQRIGYQPFSIMLAYIDETNHP